MFLTFADSAFHYFGLVTENAQNLECKLPAITELNIISKLIIIGNEDIQMEISNKIPFRVDLRTCREEADNGIVQHAVQVLR